MSHHQHAPHTGTSLRLATPSSLCIVTAVCSHTHVVCHHRRLPCLRWTRLQHMQRVHTCVRHVIAPNITLAVSDKHQALADSCLSAYRQACHALGVNAHTQVSQAIDCGRLLLLPFTTVVDYLFLLRACCMALSPFGLRALVYLAAAVSDFYVPEVQMVRRCVHLSTMWH